MGSAEPVSVSPDHPKGEETMKTRGVCLLLAAMLAVWAGCNGSSNSAPDTTVDFIENQTRYPVGISQNGLQRQHET